MSTAQMTIYRYVGVTATSTNINLYLLSDDDWSDDTDHALINPPLYQGSNILGVQPFHIGSISSMYWEEINYSSVNVPFTLKLVDDGETMQQIAFVYAKNPEISLLGIACRFSSASDVIASRFVYSGIDGKIYCTELMNAIALQEYDINTTVTYTASTDTDKPLETKGNAGTDPFVFEFFHIPDADFNRPKPNVSGQYGSGREIIDNMSQALIGDYSIDVGSDICTIAQIDEAIAWAKEYFINFGATFFNFFKPDGVVIDITTPNPIPNLPFTFNNGWKIKDSHYPLTVTDEDDNNKLTWSAYHSWSGYHYHDEPCITGLVISPYSSTYQTGSKLKFISLNMYSDDENNFKLGWFLSDAMSDADVKEFLETADIYEGDEGVEDVNTEPKGNDGKIGEEGKTIDETDVIEFPSLPVLDITATGFTKMFNPTIAQIQSLAGEFATDTNLLTEVKKFFTTEPLNCIISLHAVPYSLTTGTAEAVKFGNYTAQTTMSPITKTTYTIDCGTLDVEKFIGNALDYAPNTSASIYLPFVGTRAVNINDIMGKTIQLKYNCDCSNGCCVAFLRNNTDGELLYAWEGNMLQEFPLTSSNHNNFISSLFNLASTGVSMATAVNPMSAKQKIGEGVQALGQVAQSTAEEVINSGNIGKNTGWLGGKVPYLIINRPIARYPKNYGRYVGYPTYQRYAVKELTGFIQFLNCDVGALNDNSQTYATEEEKKMIDEILRGGFYR